MTLRNRHPLSSSFSTTTYFLYLYHPPPPPPITWEVPVELVTHSVTCWAWLLIWFACEIGRDAPMMWPDRPAVQKTGRCCGSETESQRVAAYFLRGILIWSSLPPFFWLPLRSSVKEVEWQRQGERIEADGELRRQRERETDKGLMAPQLYSLSSAVYSNGTGSRLIIYPHDLSSGVAPKHSIITTSAQAAVKHFSQQALKMLYLSIWNAHPSCSSSSLSITSY